MGLADLLLLYPLPAASIPRDQAAERVISRSAVAASEKMLNQMGRKFPL